MSFLPLSMSRCPQLLTVLCFDSTLSSPLKMGYLSPLVYKLPGGRNQSVILVYFTEPWIQWITNMYSELNRIFMKGE